MFLQVSVCPQGVSQHALQVTCRSPPAKETPLPRRLPCQGDPLPRRHPLPREPPQFFFLHFFFTFFSVHFFAFCFFFAFFSFPSFSFFFLSFFNILNKLFHHLFTPPPPVNVRAVRIPLECILVGICGLSGSIECELGGPQVKSSGH